MMARSVDRQALWRNPWSLFFRFGEKYDTVILSSDPVFLLCLQLSFNHGQGMTGMLEGGTERCI